MSTTHIVSRKTINAIRQQEIEREQKLRKEALDKRSLTGKLMGDPPPTRGNTKGTRHVAEDSDSEE